MLALETGKITHTRHVGDDMWREGLVLSWVSGGDHVSIPAVDLTPTDGVGQCRPPGTPLRQWRAGS